MTPTPSPRRRTVTLDEHGPTRCACCEKILVDRVFVLWADLPTRPGGIFAFHEACETTWYARYLECYPAEAASMAVARTSEETR